MGGKGEFCAGAGEGGVCSGEFCVGAGGGGVCSGVRLWGRGRIRAGSVVVAVGGGTVGGADVGGCKLIGGISNCSGKSSGRRRSSASDTGRRGSWTELLDWGDIEGLMESEKRRGGRRLWCEPSSSGLGVQPNGTVVGGSKCPICLRGTTLLLAKRNRVLSDAGCKPILTPTSVKGTCLRGVELDLEIRRCLSGGRDTMATRPNSVGRLEGVNPEMISLGV